MQLAARDRLEGWQRGRFRLWPSFETARFRKRAPPQDEDHKCADMAKCQFVLAACRMTRMRWVPDSAIQVSPLRPSN